MNLQKTNSQIKTAKVRFNFGVVTIFKVSLYAVLIGDHQNDKLKKEIHISDFTPCTLMYRPVYHCDPTKNSTLLLWYHKSHCFCSFIGRIEDIKKTFRN